jgi:putative two-component system response regulator
MGKFDRKKANARLLIVDDEPMIRQLLVHHLTKLGYECTQVEGGREALELLQSSSFDAVLSDILMPSMNGIELLGRIKSLNQELAVVVISGDPHLQDAVEAMKFGADDFIRKPIDFEEVSRGLDRSLRNMEAKRRVREYQRDLESMVTKRTEQVNRLFMSTIQSLIHTLEAKDPFTNGHSVRVTWLSQNLGMAAGCEAHDLELLQLGGILHDLGKIGIREKVLMKVKPLTSGEYDHIKTHPDIGVRILQPVAELTEVLPLVRHHHERYDGSGYPSGLRGEDIPLLARIISIADAYDAMTSGRPYRDALSEDEATRRLKAGAGSQFDARLVDLFLPLTQGNDFRKILSSRQWISMSPGMEYKNIATMHPAGSSERIQALRAC